MLSDINNIFVFDFIEIPQLKSGCFNKQNDYWCCNIKDFLLQVSMGLLVQKKQFIDHLYDYSQILFGKLLRWNNWDSVPFCRPLLEAPRAMQMYLESVGVKTNQILILHSDKKTRSTMTSESQGQEK